MVVDTSALIAIMQDEPERRVFNEAIVDADQAYVARDAFCRYGKGRHPAGLNYADIALLDP